MDGTAKVIKSGNSAVVVLPAEWRKENNIEIGDTLGFQSQGNGKIIFFKEKKKSQKEAFADFMAFIESLPHDTPPISDDKESDRELLASRYDE